jgi:hypothetical protein
VSDHIDAAVQREIVRRRAVSAADEAAQVRAELEQRAAAEALKLKNDREISAAVAAAQLAQPEAVRLIAEIAASAEGMVERVKRLRELHAAIEVGNARQRWMVGRPEYPAAKITIASRLPVESALITRLFQVVQHLSRMGTLSTEMPAIRAGQQEL